jgi:hypothetical protein
MIKSIILITTLVVVLMGCKTNDGKYLVYKSRPITTYSDKLNDDVTNKYANSQYQLSFADKYVSITRIGTHNTVVLADQGHPIPDQHTYELQQTEGADSVLVDYKLNITADDIILRVGASRKGHQPMFGDEAMVDFYLSKTVDQ